MAAPVRWGRPNAGCWSLSTACACAWEGEKLNLTLTVI